MPVARPRIVKVRILDRDYAFASQGEEQDARIRLVAQLVDDKMRLVQRDAGSQTPMQAAVLAGLELVDELLRLRRESAVAEQEISQRTSRLSEFLGRAFREATEAQAGADPFGDSA